MARRRAPLRDRGGQDVGYIGAARARWAPSLAALSLLLPGLDDNALGRIEAVVVVRSGNPETFERRQQVFSAERERRVAGRMVEPFSNTKPPLNITSMSLSGALERVPLSDVEALASTEIRDGLPDELFQDVTKLKGFLDWVISDRTEDIDDSAEKQGV